MEKTEIDECVRGEKEEANETTPGQFWQQNIFTIKSWKKSVIPFDRNQTRDVTIQLQCASTPRTTNQYQMTRTLATRLLLIRSLRHRPGKSQLAKGKSKSTSCIPEPEDVSIEKPKERFQKMSDTRYEWQFENLKPTLADDIRIIAHSKYDSYPTGYAEEDLRRHASYVLKDNQYFLDHTDYDATASSTLAPQGNAITMPST